MLQICIGVFFFMVLHIIGKKVAFDFFEREKDRTEKIQEELKESKRLVKENPKPQEQIEEIKLKMEELKQKVVSNKELPRIIQQLTKKSSELNIDIISVKPIKDAQVTEINLPEGISKAYIELVIKTNYRDLSNYIESLEDLPIVFTVETISIERFVNREDIAKKKIEETGKIQVIMLLSSYTVLQI